MKPKIAIIGTNGVPSKYGGFETLVEYLVEYLAGKYDITVYCSTENRNSLPREYKGSSLEYLGFRANGWQSIMFDIVSLFRAYKKNDRVLILGASGSIVLPLFYRYREKFIMNLGGMDWQRSKWNYLTRRYIKYSEHLAVKHSAHLIADNKGIQEYIYDQYKLDSTLIAYGGDQVSKIVPNSSDIDKYPFLKGPYILSVSRIQPDNNIDMLLEAHEAQVDGAQIPFVIVGNWDFDKYSKFTRNKYMMLDNVYLLNAIYNHRELNLLRSNCIIYLHGHSAGGTNPALVEAMNLALPIFTFDCNFNRYTTMGKAKYFASAQELKKFIEETSETERRRIGRNMLELAKKYYTWKKIANEYEKVINLP